MEVIMRYCKHYNTEIALALWIAACLLTLVDQEFTPVAALFAALFTGASYLKNR
jgi:hypothetical protein